MKKPTCSVFALLLSPLLALQAYGGTIINTTPITTVADEEDALWLFDADAYIRNQSTVRTFGVSSDALRTSGLRGTVINDINGVVETHGDHFAVGIRTAGDGIDVKNYGSIQTFGIGGDGIIVFGNRNGEGLLSIADPANINGNSIVNVGTIETNGAGADGIVVEGDHSVLINNGSIVNNSGVQLQQRDGSAVYENGTGVWLFGTNNQLLNTGEIINTGANSTTVQVGANSSILNTGLIENTAGKDGQSQGGLRDGAAIVTSGRKVVISNFGTINGNVYGVNGDETVLLGPGSTIAGIVNVDPAGTDDLVGYVDTLRVSSGGGASQIDGDRFVGFNAFEKTGPGSLELSGHLDISSDVLSSQALVSGGALSLANASMTADQVIIKNGAALQGSGSIFGDVQVQQGGYLAPGFSAGELNIGGNLFFDGGTLSIELGGTTGGSFDLVNVAGAADFTNANVLLSFVNGYLPSVGDLISFVTAEVILGLGTTTYFYTGLDDDFLFDISFDNRQLNFTALSNGVGSVTEPAPLAILLLGFSGLFLSRSKRRSLTKALAIRKGSLVC